MKPGVDVEGARHSAPTIGLPYRLDILGAQKLRDGIGSQEIALQQSIGPWRDEGVGAVLVIAGGLVQVVAGLALRGLYVVRERLQRQPTR